MKNALLYPYRFDHLAKDWASRLEWVTQALKEEGYKVFVHRSLSLDPPLELETWNDEPLDIVIYNHADLPEVQVKNLPTAESVWFFKPTVPDEDTTTLDELGYGSYSSITYKKPPYQECEYINVNKFFEHTVQDWINKSACKWGEAHFKEREIPHDDFYLVVGQCGGDTVVTRQDFGGYFEKLKLITKELLSVDKEREVVVKLHPYTNGPMEDPDRCDIKEPLGRELENLSPRVKAYSDHSSIHSFLPKARAVFVGNSGAGFEAMMHDKPIISFCYPEYHWVTYDLRKVCDIHNAIKLDWFDETAQRNFLYWYMEKYCFYDYNSARRRVKDLLKEEIEYKTLFL
jgi:hypothetical protein